jgi:hypothetical protein
MPKPVSVWVGDGQCQQVSNAYAANTESLDEILQTDKCYVTKSYICVKDEKPLTSKYNTYLIKISGCLKAAKPRTILCNYFTISLSMTIILNIN